MNHIITQVPLPCAYKGWIWLMVCTGRSEGYNGNFRNLLLVPIPLTPSLAVPIFLYLRLELLLVITSPLATGLSGFWEALPPFGPWRSRGCNGPPQLLACVYFTIPCWSCLFLPTPWQTFPLLNSSQVSCLYVPGISCWCPGWYTWMCQHLMILAKLLNLL